jgi:hypothetical protein
MTSNQPKGNMYIDSDTADRITISNLTQVYKDYFRLKEFNDRIALSNSQTPNGHHTEEYMYNVRLIDSLKAVLEYFGENVKIDKDSKF